MSLVALSHLKLRHQLLLKFGGLITGIAVILGSATYWVAHQAL